MPRHRIKNVPLGLKVGDSIVSPIGALGRVSEIRQGAVVVTYAERRQSWTASYDSDWFARYGHLLKKL